MWMLQPRGQRARGSLVIALVWVGRVGEFRRSGGSIGSHRGS